MKRISSALIISFWSIFLYSQAVYMHEAQEDWDSSDGFPTLGLITLSAIAFIIWLAIKLITNTQERNAKIKEIKEKERNRINELTIKNGGFVCPVCGKAIQDNNYKVFSNSYIGVKRLCRYEFKLCVNCGYDYIHYESDHKNYHRFHDNNKSLPDWFGCLTMIVLAAGGIAGFIVEIRKGEIFFAFLSLIQVPLAILLIFGGTGFLIYKIICLIMAPIHPKKPFDFPSKEQAEKCNALVSPKGS